MSQLKLFDEAIYNEPCPFEMKWDCTGWHSTHPVFKQLLDETKAKLVIEVGSWKGASAIHMCHVCPDVRVICVDTFLGGADHWASDQPQDEIPKCCGYPTMYYQFLYNVKRSGLTKQITPVPLTSRAAAVLLKNASADLIYIDGSHQYEDALNDMHDYWPMVRKGGAMFGDDVGFTDVRKAVDHFCDSRRKYEVVAENFWIIRA